MMLFGRANTKFPSVWLRLLVPHEPDPGLVGAALASGAPICISSQPALWGGAMRGTEAVLFAKGVDPSAAFDHRNASELTQAKVIEILSCIGRDYLDFYGVPIRTAPEEFQIDGVLSALETMRQEGLIRFVALVCDGPALAALGMWQFHDAFEALVVPLGGSSYDLLVPMAEERRVGVLGVGEASGELGHPVLVGVRNQAEIKAATAQFTPA